MTINRNVLTMDEQPALEIKKNFSVKPLIFGSFAAAFEWYDYALFGYFATIIGAQFFPSSNPTTSLLSSFGVFASGFFMRPLGAFLFGYVGDRVGRKYALGGSLLLMAIPTTALGFLPNYDAIGIWAPIGLVIIRLLQGLSVGGNYGGSFIFTIENAPEGKKSMAGSLPSFGTLGGFFLGSGAAALLSSLMTEGEIYAYGWRIPFLFGSLSAFVGLALHHYLEEDQPKLTEYQKSISPIQQIFKDHLRDLVRAMSIILLDGVGVYVLFLFMPTFSNIFVGLPSPQANLVNTLCMGLLVGTIPVFGWLGDVWGAKRILKIVSLTYVGLAFPLFLLLIETKSLGALIFLQGTFAIVMGAVYGALPLTVAHLFPKHVRYTASGLAFNVSIAVFGGTMPFVVTSLIRSTGNKLVPAFFLTAVGILSWWALSADKKSY